MRKRRNEEEEETGFVVLWQRSRILSSLKDICLNIGEFYQIVEKLWQQLLGVGY